MLDDLRRRVLAAADETVRLGLSTGTSGNVSAKDPESGRIVITPSGIRLDEITAGDLVVLDDCGRLIEGSLPPSSETPLHIGVYKARPGTGGIVHTHSVYCTVFSAVGKQIPTVTVPLAVYGPVRVAPFYRPGSKELAEAVARELAGSPADGRGSAVLLRNHGAICIGDTIEEALTCAVYVEEGAKVACLAIALGEPRVIPPEEADAIKNKAREGKAV